MRIVGNALVVAALAIFAVGLAVVPLTLPVVTRLGIDAYATPQDAGLTKPRAVELGEGVRAYVASNAETATALPATIDGRPGFDAATVSHLADVRGVIRGARGFTGLLAAIITLWMATWVARRDTRRIATALRFAAIVDAVAVTLLAAVAVVNFDAFFSAFHGLFFKAGTWTFPDGALITTLFPEPFWIAEGVGWGVCVLLIAGAYALAAKGLEARQSA